MAEGHQELQAASVKVGDISYRFVEVAKSALSVVATVEEPAACASPLAFCSSAVLADEVVAAEESGIYTGGEASGALRCEQALLRGELSQATPTIGVVRFAINSPAGPRESGFERPGKRRPLGEQREQRGTTGRLWAPNAVSLLRGDVLFRHIDC